MESTGWSRSHKGYSAFDLETAPRKWRGIRDGSGTGGALKSSSRQDELPKPSEPTQGGVNHVGPEQEARSTIPGRGGRADHGREDRPELGPDRDRGPLRDVRLSRGDPAVGERA